MDEIRRNSARFDAIGIDSDGIERDSALFDRNLPRFDAIPDKFLYLVRILSPKRVSDHFSYKMKRLGTIRDAFRVNSREIVAGRGSERFGTILRDSAP